MKAIIFRYGLLASLSIVVLGALHIAFVQTEWAGYLTMLLSMIFVFIGIRRYRDHVNGGSLSFGEGLKIGILIVLIPSVAFGLLDILYTEVINPQWMDQYYADQQAKILASGDSQEKVQAALKKMTNEKEMFSNPVVQFVLMSVTVFIVGLIVTVISSLTLMTKKKKAIA